MDYQKIALWVVGFLGLLAFLGVHLGGASGVFGSISPAGEVKTNTTWFTNGIFGGSTQQFSVDASGNVIAGKNLTLTTSNTATSRAVVGCVQTYATSTATPINIQFATTTPANASYPTGTLSTGIVTWKYGTCPI